MMNTNKWSIRSADEKDIPGIIDVHIQAFPHFFLTSLGPSFIKLIYKAFLNVGCVFLVATINHEIRGFAVGVPHASGRDKVLLLSFIPRLIIAIIPSFFRSPIKILKRIAFELLTSQKLPEIPNNAIVLRSIGVLQVDKGSGLAVELLKNFEDCAKKSGAQSVALTTDAINNDYVIKFYRNNGYQIANNFYQSKKRQMYLMMKHLN